MSDVHQHFHDSGYSPSAYDDEPLFLQSVSVPPHHHALKIAVIGGYSPRRCGIATYTSHSVEALKSAFPSVLIDIYAMAPSCDFKFDDGVTQPIVEGEVSTFLDAARRIESSQADVIWLQHEFGLYGGPAGNNILKILDATAAPLAVTFHTVLAEPDPDQKEVVNRIIARAACIFVMSHQARRFLIDIYGADEDQVIFVPHGVPDRPFGRAAAMKQRLGLQDRPVLMTFGLLSPGKGIENAISAMPAILAEFPDTVYCVVGATHPNLIAKEGEKYRDRLMSLASALGVNDSIRWFNEFYDDDSLLDLLEATDIYLTPYSSPSQATSGTLSYAVALGKAVVSTPYVHAKEILADGHGILVPFHDSNAISSAVNSLLGDSELLATIQRRAFVKGRDMLWSAFAATTMNVIGQTKIDRRIDTKSVAKHIKADQPLVGFLRVCDDTGIIQHSRHNIPDRSHGYCVDDNARALMLVNRIPHRSDVDTGKLATVFASFVQDAWNPEVGSFRNFMDFRRNWLEPKGSEDSCARAIWALGATAREGKTAEIRRWAADLFKTTAGSALGFKSPRATAFSMLAADHILAVDPQNALARRLASNGLEHLKALLCDARRPDWAWFEHVLAYDNCRIPEALIRLGQRVGDAEALECGLETLDWISQHQTAPSGHFRCVGSTSFGQPLTPPQPYDQQPVEAWAAIDAAQAAYAVTRNRIWVSRALSAYAWFLGDNDRGIAVADSSTGSCRDGITPRGVNLNEGAESVLSFHLAHFMLKSLLGQSDDQLSDAQDNPAAHGNIVQRTEIAAA